MVMGHGLTTGINFNVHCRDRLCAYLTVLAVAGLLLEIRKGEV